jgi:hypothetical protein
MEKKCIILFHQGWTDIILCIGLVFYNLKYYDEIYLLIRDDSKDMINFIFRNNDNVKTIFIKNDLLNNSNVRKNYIYNIASKYSISNDNILLYGGCLTHCGYGKHNNYKSINCNEGSKDYFYSTYNIDSIECINSFNISRDYTLENNKYEEIISKIGNNYVIVFNDIKRNLFINNNYIVNKELPTFNLCESSTICFDMIKVINESKEIHILSTFWSLIIYNLQKKYNLFMNIPIYFHNEVRNDYYSFLYENTNWIIC